MSDFGACNGCAERVVGCHSTCQRYLDEKAALDEKKQKIAKNKQGERDEYYVRVDSIKKIKRRQRLRG